MKSINEVFESGNTKIWYVKPEYIQDFMMGSEWVEKKNLTPTIDTINTTHVLLGSIDNFDLENIYNQLQGENWSPKGQARELIKDLGLCHTSMSMGDIIEIDFILYMVDSIGFTTLNEEELR